MKLNIVLICGMLAIASCKNNSKSDNYDLEINPYKSSKPMARWWWFSSKIKKADIKYQLDWIKNKNFGGVEIAWVYPLYRYKKLYAKMQNRHYKKDTSAQKWLSDEWIDVVQYAFKYADSIGLNTDFTFGSAWPSASGHIGAEYSTQIYGDTSFRQELSFAWSYPKKQLVINHLDSQAFRKFSTPIKSAFKKILKDKTTNLFIDSWEIKLNATNKVWTKNFEQDFKEKFSYDILPYMEKGLDSFPDVRYDYMQLLEEKVIDGFYKPFTSMANDMNCKSRVQCLASPTNIMNTYALVDIPESEAMLNNPNFSKIVTSSALLSSKNLVSAEAFTCMYGFPSTYLREEQTADLKLVADALFAQGINHLVYHGLPYNPKGSDTVEFFATTYFGPGGKLDEELTDFNKYIEKVCGYMQQGNLHSDLAVYIPYEDGVMKGAYPDDKQRVWVWGEYELRHIDFPEETKGYNPIWINHQFLEKAKYIHNKLYIGNACISVLYIDVKYMDFKALKRILQLAKEGLNICLKQTPLQPGLNKNPKFNKLLKELISIPNVYSEFSRDLLTLPLIESQTIPSFSARLQKDSSLIIFIAQEKSHNLKYPVYYGQSFMDTSNFLNITFNYNGNRIKKLVEFKPYQSILLKISSEGNFEQLDIKFNPTEPIIREKEKQKMYF